MIKFSVSRLDKEPIELSGCEDKEFISLPEGDAYTVTAPLKYDLYVAKVSGGALVSGSCRTEIAGICGRCLPRKHRSCRLRNILGHNNGFILKK